MKSSQKDDLLSLVRNGGVMSLSQQLKLTAELSLPSMMAQISFIIMQYIDAAMVGRLGTECSAAVGLINTSTWLFYGLGESVTIGFSVLVAHRLGANDAASARKIVRQAIFTCVFFSAILMFVGVTISGRLPYWLGGGEDIAGMSSDYFFIFALSMPIFHISYLAASMLRSSGNMKIPSILNVMVCFLDVLFNFFLIYPDREINLFTHVINIPGAGFGVKGAALGTAMAQSVGAIFMFGYLIFKSKDLKIYGEKGSFIPEKNCLKNALKIGIPVGFERIIMSSAYICLTAIIAPLGNIAIAADTFAVTVESLCYMPGYGIADAATTLVGQSIGAGRRTLAKQFAYITVFSGIVVMTITAAIMYIFALDMMQLMTPIDEIAKLGAEVLRIEAFAEPMFAAAIVAYGVFVGAGDSLTPSLMNLLSMWGLRITSAAFLAPSMGLKGVWIVMAAELSIRGVMFLIRLKSSKWLKNTIKSKVK